MESIPIYAFEALNGFAREIHGENVRKGWWNADPEMILNGRPQDNINICATKLALIHSEISEALEGLRKGVADDHLPHRRMEEVEIADALIRIFDYAGARELDLASAMREKMEYNRVRADHKPEARAAAGGKKI